MVLKPITVDISLPAECKQMVYAEWIHASQKTFNGSRYDNFYGTQYIAISRNGIFYIIAHYQGYKLPVGKQSFINGLFMLGVNDRCCVNEHCLGLALLRASRTAQEINNHYANHALPKIIFKRRHFVLMTDFSTYQKPLFSDFIFVKWYS